MPYSKDSIKVQATRFADNRRYEEEVGIRRRIALDTVGVTYVCSACNVAVEGVSLKEVILRKDIGSYCGDMGTRAIMNVKINTLPVIDREFWQGLVNVSIVKY